MDTLYVGNIPLEYCYAVFYDNYVDLYNGPVINANSDFYRVYFYDHAFLYNYFISSTSFVTVDTVKINTTSNFLWRRDIDSIFIVSFIIISSIILLFNIVTSAFKKGGLFSGLI